MKMITYLPLMLVPLVAACAANPPDKMTDGCARTTHITITPDKAAVSAAPEHICVNRGDTITVKVVRANKDADNPKKGSVSMTPKEGKNTWLSGSNGSDAGKFELFVNDKVVNGTYKYIVNTQGGAELDPRVTVDDN